MLAPSCALRSFCYQSGFTWGGRKPLPPYSGRSLSIAVKAHLPRAGVVHSAQCAKPLCIVLYHNVRHQKHSFGYRRSDINKDKTPRHPPPSPSPLPSPSSLAVAVAIAAAAVCVVVAATAAVSAAVVISAVVVVADCCLCLPLSLPPPPPPPPPL